MGSRAIRRDADEARVDNTLAVRRLRGASAREQAPGDPAVDLAGRAARRTERSLLAVARMRDDVDPGA